MFTLLSHKSGDICVGDEGIVRDVQFFVTREYSPELLDIAAVMIGLYIIFPPFCGLLGTIIVSLLTKKFRKFQRAILLYKTYKTGRRYYKRG